jgi:uncharacterized protein with FMN-binding domain
MRVLFVVTTILAAVIVHSCDSEEIVVHTPRISSLADGTYRGSCDGGLVSATVDVVVSDQRIEQVIIVSHRCGKGRPAEEIVNDVVAEQSLDVDVISGATRSSQVILKAVEVALSQ